MKLITRAICPTCHTDQVMTMAAADRWADKHIRETGHPVETPTTPERADEGERA